MTRDEMADATEDALERLREMCPKDCIEATRTCGLCNGRGGIVTMHGLDWEMGYECPDCKGDGYVVYEAAPLQAIEKALTRLSRMEQVNAAAARFYRMQVEGIGPEDLVDDKEPCI